MKAELRRKYAELRKGISDKGDKDGLICSAFINSDFYKNADEILCYYPIKSEINTLTIIEQAINDGKKLCLPVCTDAEGIMKFYRCSSFQDLIDGKFGLKEPDAAVCKPVDCFENAVCIVPAYTFDKKGYRLGYGGGYYDRFLYDFKHIKIGLCYDELLAEELPYEPYDIKVDYILTESGFKKVFEED